MRRWATSTVWLDPLVRTEGGRTRQRSVGRGQCVLAAHENITESMRTEATAAHDDITVIDLCNDPGVEPCSASNRVLNFPTLSSTPTYRGSLTRHYQVTSARQHTMWPWPSRRTCPVPSITRSLWRTILVPRAVRCRCGLASVRKATGRLCRVQVATLRSHSQHVPQVGKKARCSSRVSSRWVFS